MTLPIKETMTRIDNVINSHTHKRKEIWMIKKEEILDDFPVWNNPQTKKIRGGKTNSYLRL